MAVMLLVGGALLIHSFLRLSSVENGYNPTNVLTFQAAPLGSSRAEGVAFADRLIARLASLPGVTAVGYSNNLPLIQQGFSRDVSSRPLPPGQRAPRPYPSLHAVSPGFVQALGLRIVEGRTFSAGEPARREALVSRAFANSGFFDGPALGRQIYGGRSPGKSSASWRTFASSISISRRAPRCSSSTSLLRRLVSAGPISQSGPRPRRWRSAPMSARSSVRSIRPPPSTTSRRWSRSCRTQSRVRGCMRCCWAASRWWLSRSRRSASTVSSRSSSRTGLVRLAFAWRSGRGPAAVVSLVVRQSAVQIVIGVAAGIGGAAMLSRYLEGLLFGVTPLDTLTFAIAGVTFTMVALAAAYGPARRATQVDPLIALRAE